MDFNKTFQVQDTTTLHELKTIFQSIDEQLQTIINNPELLPTLDKSILDLDTGSVMLTLFMSDKHITEITSLREAIQQKIGMIEQRFKPESTKVETEDDGADALQSMFVSSLSFIYFYFSDPPDIQAALREFIIQNYDSLTSEAGLSCEAARITMPAIFTSNRSFEVQLRLYCERRQKRVAKKRTGVYVLKPEFVDQFRV